jgi:hypothetical protein
MNYETHICVFVVANMDKWGEKKIIERWIFDKQELNILLVLKGWKTVINGSLNCNAAAIKLRRELAVLWLDVET